MTYRYFQQLGLIYRCIGSLIGNGAQCAAWRMLTIVSYVAGIWLRSKCAAGKAVRAGLA